MPDFTYTGDLERVYITLSVDGHTLQVAPGDTVTLDVDPNLPEFQAVASKTSKKPSAPSTVATIPDVAGADVATSDSTTDPTGQES